MPMIFMFLHPEEFMCASNVEELISDLDPEVSKIYFDAKDVLVNANDSNNERFLSSRSDRSGFLEESCVYDHPIIRST
jgi:hypothetical protein